MALKVVSYLLTTVILQAELSTSFRLGFPFPELPQFPELPAFPELSGFHRLLSKNQLMKYFNVQNYDDVPKYEFAKIGLKVLDPLYWTEKFENLSSGNVFEPQDMFISAEYIFGHSIQMKLRRNDRLLAPSFKVIQIEDDDAETEYVGSFPICHYFGVNGSIAAALSSCKYTSAKGLSGSLLLPNEGVQIQPIDQELASLIGLLDNQLARFLSNSVVEILHLVSKPKMKSSDQEERRNDEISIPFSSEFDYDPKDSEGRPQNPNIEDFDSFSHNVNEEYKPKYFSGRDRRSNPDFPAQKQGEKELYLELAVFCDQAGYAASMPFMKSEEKLRESILGFINQVQALFQQPSLSKKLQFRVVRMELWKKQPIDLPHGNGRQGALLKPFCNYQKKRNPTSDNDPNHWDLALYLSALDLHSVENGKKKGIMGVAYRDGVCRADWSCALIEFGTVNGDGTPTVSSGYHASYTAAHEIGHNLGMRHDGVGNNCPTRGHMMEGYSSPGYTPWSRCSLNLLENLNQQCLLDAPQAKPRKDKDHSKYNDKPGQVWDAHQQCKIHLKDDYATLKDEKDIASVCDRIWCKSGVDRNNRYKIHSAGPALEGTYCGYQKWCQRGKCVPMNSKNVQRRWPNRKRS